MNANNPVALRAMFTLLLVGAAVPLHAQLQQPQIPTLQVCNDTLATGKAAIVIQSRADAQHQGSFEVVVELRCDQKSGYPTGSVQINNINMSDSIVSGNLVSTAIEQVTSTGKSTPTLYVNGRCKAEGAPGCRFWLMVASNRDREAAAANKGTPDVVSFLVFNGAVGRFAYGTCPVLKGDIDVKATPN